MVYSKGFLENYIVGVIFVFLIFSNYKNRKIRIEIMRVYFLGKIDEATNEKNVAIKTRSLNRDFRTSVVKENVNGNLFFLHLKKKITAKS